VTSYFVNGQISGWELKATHAHEQKHIEQYRRFKTCAAFDWYYHSDIGRLESEAEAYVAGWCAVFDDVSDAGRLESVSLYNLTRHGYDIMTVLQAWNKYHEIECPEKKLPTNLVPTQ